MRKASAVQRMVVGCWMACCLMSSGCVTNSGTVMADIVTFNHTDHDIRNFSINEVTGAGVARHGASETSLCCLRVPREYQRDFTLTVSWSDDALRPPQTLVAVPPPYLAGSNGGHVSVHFLRNGDVKVFVDEY
ncbi:DUF3304 domain-containing protein [Ralstonia insidiosa]|nr:DUF3304 domain-containing protein [Ralstonia insidiosa]